MKLGKLLSPEEVLGGQEVIVVPSGDGVAVAPGMGNWPRAGTLDRVSDQVLGAAHMASSSRMKFPV